MDSNERKPVDDEILDEIANQGRTDEEIAEATDLAIEHVRVRLRALRDAEEVERDESGEDVEYYAAES